MKQYLWIAIILALALVYWKRNVPHNDEPCKNKSDINAYDRFAGKHILQESVPTTEEEWQRYLRDNGLCDSARQTFFKQTDEDNVKLICNYHGKRTSGNLCISNAKMWVYEVTVTDTKKCTINNLLTTLVHVIVACDEIGNGCFPVHFEGSSNSGPTKGAEICRPLSSSA